MVLFYHDFIVINIIEAVERVAGKPGVHYDIETT